MQNKLFLIIVFIFLLFLSNCVSTPFTSILFYNDTNAEVWDKRSRINDENREEIINKYDSFEIVSPGNLLLPEYEEDRIYRNLLNNGYGPKKMIINGDEYIITAKMMAYILSNYAIYDYDFRHYYIRITDLLIVLLIDTQNVSNIKFTY